MATLEVTLKYQPPIARVLHILILLLAPFWLGLPLISLLPTNLTTMLDLWWVTSNGSLTLAYFVPGLVFGISGLLITRDDKMVISQQGICLPSAHRFVLSGRRNRTWYDLQRVDLFQSGGRRGNENADLMDQSLELTFASGGIVAIKLKELTLTEIEQLFLAIETFAPSIQNISSLQSGQRQLGEQLRITGIKSYTNLWEDELRYRYSSTTFIPLAPGQKLLSGELKVIRQLGFGGLSAIYLVQRSGKDLLVLKESTVPSDVDDELKSKAIEMFDREAKILSKLSHARIAKVFDHFVENDRHYLLLQYVHGEDLRQHVKEHGAMSESAVIDCGIQIAEILQYLHQSNPPVIHRDLTPENLVIGDDGKIVLIDFGAANEFLQTATGTLVGKHSYIAPEQFRGKATTCSDLYSLGGTLHFLLTATDPVALSSSSPIQLNEAVSAELNELITRLTKTNVKDRVQSATDAKELLVQCNAIRGSV